MTSKRKIIKKYDGLVEEEKKGKEKISQLEKSLEVCEKQLKNLKKKTGPLPERFSHAISQGSWGEALGLALEAENGQKKAYLGEVAQSIVTARYTNEMFPSKNNDYSAGSYGLKYVSSNEYEQVNRILEYCVNQLIGDVKK